MQKEKLLQARVPEKLYKEVNNKVKNGFYANRSELVREALRKMFAEQSREFLRDIMKQAGITQEEMLEELKKIRDSY